MDRRNYSDLGEEIRDIVQSAVNTMDFHQLNRDIGNTVRGALDEVRHSLGTGYGSHRQNNPDGAGENWNPNNGRKNYNRERDYRREDRYQNRDYRRDAGRQSGQANSSSSQYRQPYTQQGTRQSQNPAMQANTALKKQQRPFPCEPVGRVSGILLTVFGSIGLGIFGVGAFVLAIIGRATANWGVFGTISMGLVPFFGLSLCMMAAGRKQRKRLGRYRRYIGLFGGHAYYSIKELAGSVGQNPKFVLRDLRRMISIGMFPEGRIDDQETCVMLNRESYIQYLELQKNMRIQAEERGMLQNRQGDRETGEVTPGQEKNQQVRQAIEAGRACIEEIREANDAIPGEEISRKLDRLEDVIGKIFNYIEQHPGQLTDIQKFMDYYLPTTLKLVNAYKEFEKQSIQGDNITTAKKEIEETLDTINLAFENLLDSLFEDAAMDVSSDISVLETLLAQEGLTKKDFVSNE